MARTINEQFTRLRDSQPEVLARHWTQAGETEQAIAEWSRAGKAAEARNAFSDGEVRARTAEGEERTRMGALIDYLERQQALT